MENTSKVGFFLKTVAFIEKFVASQMSILDLGAYASEIMVILLRMGFTNLHGIDFNKHISMMPGAVDIHFVIGDFILHPIPINPLMPSPLFLLLSMDLIAIVYYVRYRGYCGQRDFLSPLFL